ncbi:hypothetical protein IWQ62_006117, partial [Dispira parvispora]
MISQSHRNSCIEPTPDSTALSRARANSSRLSLPPFFQWRRTSKDGAEQGSVHATDARRSVGHPTPIANTQDSHFRRHQVMSQDYLTEQRQFAQTLRAFPMPVSQNETSGSDIHIAHPIGEEKDDLHFPRLAPSVDPSSPTSTLTPEVSTPPAVDSAHNNHGVNTRDNRVSTGNGGSNALYQAQFEHSPRQGDGSSQRTSLTSMPAYVHDESPADTLRASSHAPGKPSALEKGDLDDFTDHTAQDRAIYWHWLAFVALWIVLIGSLAFMWLAVRNKPALIAIPIIVALVAAGMLIWLYKKYIFNSLCGGGMFVFPMNPQGAFPAATLPTHANHQHQPPTAPSNHSTLAMPPAVHGGHTYMMPSSSDPTPINYGPGTTATTTPANAGDQLSSHPTRHDRPTGAPISADNTLPVQPPPSYQQA